MSIQGKKKNSSISNRAAQERKTQLIQQRQRTQQIMLMVGAVAFLVVIVIGIFIATRPADVTIAADINTRFDGISVGTTSTAPMTDVTAYPISFPYMGDPNAPVKIEEISSFSCPYCLAYHQNTGGKIVDEIKAGRAQFVYIFTTHTGDYSPAGILAVTQAAVCAMQQNKFWQMHDILFDWQSQYAEGTADPKRLDAAANRIGLDMGKFDSCLTSPDTTKYIEASNTYADARGLIGTPSVFLFANGTQVLPQTQNPRETPRSVAGLAIGDLRGIIEAASTKKS